VQASSSFAGILEIGPGPGVLTRPLSMRGPLTAVEVDSGMAAAAQAAAPAAQVRNLDALSADWSSLLAELPAPRGIVSNMPYNLTGPLLGRVADQASQITGAVLMMQAEVGTRITAPAGNRDRGFLSVWLQALFSIRRVISVPPGCFTPPPKVDSVVLAFSPLPGAPPSPELLSLVKQGFSHPRKTLANCLSSRKAAPAIAAVGLSPTVRPHEVTWEEWQAIHHALARP
jgi:16S rRNA (adenine1518-N6/adenine1519-N6)-dimethyltransferase